MSQSLNCKIDLDRLLPTPLEGQRFDNKWDAFLASDHTNKKIFTLRKKTLSYESEQLNPEKKDKGILGTSSGILI